MSDYKKMVVDEAKGFLADEIANYDADAGEFGGASAAPNFSKWLEQNRKLFTRLDERTKDWGRGEQELVRAGSRNSVNYGDPKEAAYFAFYKDVLAELKKHMKKRR